MNRDQHFMRLAVNRAALAARGGHRPFGCIIVDERGRVIAATAGSETASDPIRHSEVEAIRIACRDRGRLLQGCTLYSTHEPCAMCCGAINHSKVGRVVWGSYRSDIPELFRARNLPGVALLLDTSHPPDIYGGCLREECVRLFDGEVAEKLAEGVAA